MLDAYVQKIVMPDTVEFFLELNSALGIGARTPKFSFYVYCIWISKFTLAVADPSKEFSTNFFIRCLTRIYVSEYNSLNTPIDL